MSKAFNRERRDSILRFTDCKMLSDHPTTKQSEWKTYRQELRDMDFSDPDNTTWPTPPDDPEGEE